MPSSTSPLKSPSNPNPPTITERMERWQNALTERIDRTHTKQREQYLTNLDIPRFSPERSGVCLIPTSNECIQAPLAAGLSIKATNGDAHFNGQIAHTHTPWPGSIHACTTHIKRWRLILNWQPIGQPTPTSFTLYFLTDLARSLAVHLLQHTACITCYPQQAPTLKNTLAWRPALYTTPALQTHPTHRGNILSRWQDVTQCPSAYSGIHLSHLKPAHWPVQTKRLVIDFDLTQTHENATPLDPASCTLHHLIVLNRQTWQSDPWYTQAHQHFYQLRPPPPPQHIKQLHHINGAENNNDNWLITNVSPTLDINCLIPPTTTQTLSACFITAENHWHRLPTQQSITWETKQTHKIRSRCLHFFKPSHQESDINACQTLHQSRWETWAHIKRWIQYLCPEHSLSDLSDKIDQQKKSIAWQHMNHAYRPVATITYIIHPKTHYAEHQTDWFYWALLCLYTWQTLDTQGVHYQLRLEQNNQPLLKLPNPLWTPATTLSPPISHAPN